METWYLYQYLIFLLQLSFFSAVGLHLFEASFQGEVYSLLGFIFTYLARSVIFGVFAYTVWTLVRTQPAPGITKAVFDVVEYTALLFVVNFAALSSWILSAHLQLWSRILVWSGRVSMPFIAISCDISTLTMLFASGVHLNY